MILKPQQAVQKGRYAMNSEACDMTINLKLQTDNYPKAEVKR